VYAYLTYRQFLLARQKAWCGGEAREVSSAKASAVGLENDGRRPHLNRRLGSTLLSGNNLTGSDTNHSTACGFRGRSKREQAQYELGRAGPRKLAWFGCEVIDAARGTNSRTSTPSKTPNSWT
jgi:hypothetical protein